MCKIFCSWQEDRSDSNTREKYLSWRLLTVALDLLQLVCHAYYIWSNDSFPCRTYIYNASPSIWGSILSLSSPGRWDFPRIHALALHNLNNLFLPTVDRIVLYTNCSVSFEHLLLLYVELCTRETSLSLEESIRLGSNLVVPIWQIRESLLRGEDKIEAADATQDNGTAAAGIPERWIRDQIRYRLNAVQDISSMMDTHKHYCLLHHEVQELFVPGFFRWAFDQSIVSLIFTAFKLGLKREKDTRMVPPTQRKIYCVQHRLF